MRKALFYSCILSFLLQLLFSSCRDEHTLFEGDIDLIFSVDTLRFDTVFTSLGSATRTLKVYNESSYTINISDIALLEGDQSLFRLNVDGIATNHARDVEILGNDSLYIFVEVTIDPDAPLSESPFIVEEALLFLVNGDEQSVLLEAWGQNANYIPNRYSAGTLNLLSCGQGTVSWSDPKPYVIYGILFIDSCTLVFPPGAEIYVHGGVANVDGTIFNDGLIVVLEKGSVRANGSLEEPVTIQGDRLESEFDNVPGQWSGIRISSASLGNVFNHAIIKNSIVGIRADSASSLEMRNVQIFNTTGSGVIGVHSNITVQNSLIHSNGNFSALLTYGGTYNFYYTTLANYGNQSSALHLDNFRCSDPQCLDKVFINRMKANFINCIITGSAPDEIDLVDAVGENNPDQFQFQFDHCIVTVDELLSSNAFPNFFDNCENCINSSLDDTLFVDIDIADFHLDTLSIAEMNAVRLAFLPTDLEENIRDPNNPDIGCYEFQE